MASSCPIESSKEWKQLVYQVGDKLAWVIYETYDGYPPQLDSVTNIKKEAKIPSKAFGNNLPTLYSNIKKYNATKSTSHVVKATQIGQSQQYNIELLVNYLPVNLEKRRQREYQKANPNVQYKLAFASVYESDDKPVTFNERLKQIEELFESNPELANAVYSKILTNSGLSAENLLSLLEKENIVEKDCSGGKLKAKDGISTLFDKGGKWKIVTDFKNAPTHKSGGKDIFIQGKKVEVEKNELKIENDFGDVAVIPSKYRIEVQDAIKSNCHSCIDGIVESLPKMKDYAGDGTVFPFFGRYKRFKNSLPDNLKNTPEDEYAMRYYWKHSNKPKSFDEAINREQPMFTMEDDGYYHAPSVEPNTLRFLKPKTHPTLQYELDWYNSDNPKAVDFRNKYDLDTSDKFYRYIPKKR